MRSRKIPFLLLLGSLLFLINAVLPAPAVEAQCGSEASSCKDCHEVQGQFPVNNDGTAWHESHAFGDFCYICHAGNLQSTDADAAHEGMAPPLSDTEASCQACHPNDLTERAQVYATALGIALGGDASEPTPVATAVQEEAPAAEQAPETVQATSIPATAQPTDCPQYKTQLAVDDPNLVDYVQRYNEIVLGERPVNWGNIALIGMIALIVLGGGSFVVFNEIRLSRLPRETATLEGEYPAEVVEMLPGIANLKPKTRKSLKKILNNPAKTDKVLGLIDAVVEDDETEE